MKKKIVTILVVLVIISCNLPIVSNAAVLQASSSNNPIAQNVMSMWDDIKDMETGTLGLNPSNLASDGIDCHMIKNSEYGAAILLTISAYGAGSTACNGVNKKISSTGNASGVYQLMSSGWEWCSAVYTGKYTGSAENQQYYNFLNSKDSKYVDKYSVTNLESYNNLSEGQIKGDAMFPLGFLGSTYAGWVNGSYPVFIRGNGYGGLFSYDGNAGAFSTYGRAVVVCGSGL